MPAKKKRKAPTQKQKQSQRQSVVVNIASTKKPRKKSGKGSLPPPSYQHNLAPTFVTNQQIDYTPLISSILHASNKIGEANSLSNRVIDNPITPLSSVAHSSAQTAREMAGVRAEERRAGPTAGNLQPLTSQADERYAEQAQMSFDEEDREAFKRKMKQGGGGGGIPFAESYSLPPVEAKAITPKTRGRPAGSKDTTPRVRRTQAEISQSRLPARSKSEEPNSSTKNIVG